MRPVLLVTGGRGLLGSRVVPLLAEKAPGCRVIVVARGEGRDRREGGPLANIEVVRGDLRDESLWAGLPADITHVVHLAAFIPWKAEDRCRARVVADNLLPLANLLEYSRRWAGLRQVVYSSSVSVYAPTSQVLCEDSPTRPATLYGASKLAGEALLRPLEYGGVAVASLRLSSLYGHGQYEGTVLPLMVSRAARGQDLLVFGDGSRTQDFLHCEDAARAVLASLQKDARGAFNVGSGTPVTMAELARAASQVFSDGAARVVRQPERADSDPGVKLDVSKANRELDFRPSFRLERGLRRLKEEMEGAH